MQLLRSMIAGLVLALIATGCSNNGDDVLEASGTIEGTDISIGSEVGGKILSVRVTEGARVDPGDTMVVIDESDYFLQYRQAKANADAAEAQYRLALEGSRREDILQAEANLTAAEADYRRMKELLESRTVTQKQYDDAMARYVSAQQTFKKLASGLRKEEILAARARLDQATAQAEYLEKKLRDCRIIAPTNATVTLRSVEPGELVAPGMNLLRLTRLDRVKLTIYGNEKDLGKVKLGQKAHVFIDAFPDRPFEGSVVYISPAAEFTPKNVQTKEERTKLVFAVRLEIDNPEGVLKPGLPADARIMIGESSGQ